MKFTVQQDISCLKHRWLLAISVLLFFLFACGCNGKSQVEIQDDKKEQDYIMYQQISQKEAKRIIDSDDSVIILDVREKEEFDEGHIPGAILLPYTEIDNKANEILRDKDALILVYCRSGRRSKIAAEALSRLGYSNIKEFGGIIDWPYDIVK